MQPDGTPSDRRTEHLYRQRLLADSRSPNPAISKVHPYFKPYLGVNTGRATASPNVAYSWPAGTEVQYRVMAADSSVSNSPREQQNNGRLRPSPDSTKPFHSPAIHQLNGGYQSSGHASSTTDDTLYSIVQYTLDSRLKAALASLLTVGCPAIVMTILSMQLLFNLQYYRSNLSPIVAGTWSTILQDTCLVLCSITLAFSSAAFFTAFLQLFLSIKAIKLHPESQVRVLRYLRGGMILRFISFIGFFLSIPMYLISVLLSLQSSSLETASPAVVAVFIIVGAGGVLLMICTIAHSVYSWLWGHIDNSDNNNNKLPNLDKNLSTLV